MTKIVRQLDLASDGGSGAANVPLGNQWNEGNFRGQKLNDDGTPYVEPAAAKVDDNAATPEAESKELQTLLEKDELTETEKTRLEALKVKYDVAELDADGKPITPEAKKAIQDTQTRLKAIKSKPEAQRTAEEVQFITENTPPPVKPLYEQVDELGGTKYEVDYQGKAPDSPEGVILREEVIRTQAANAYDAQLKEEYPRAYQFFTHLQAGGKEEDFFASHNKDFSAISLTKADVSGQEMVYRQALGIKGINAEQVETLVTAAKDKGKLFDLAKGELDTLQAKQKEDADRREAQVVSQGKARDEALNSFADYLQKAINKGINNVPIPASDRKPFEKFVGTSVFYDKGRILHVTELNSATFMEDLAAFYFRYKKGDLSAVVKREAMNQNANGIKGKLQYKITPKSTNEPPRRQVALGDI